MDGQKTGAPEDGQIGAQPTPGETIQPGQQAIPQQPTQIPGSTAMQDTAAGLFRADEGATGYAPFADPDYQEPNFSPDDIVEWTASEFVAHNKTGGWYLVLITLAASVAVLVWFLTHDIVSPVVVVLAGIILGSYANRKPRQLQYRADPGGLTIGERYYSFNDFKGFTVVHDGAFSNLVFYPMQRFGFIVTVYYDPQDEDRILDLISQRVPYDENKRDPIDNLMRRIRF